MRRLLSLVESVLSKHRMGAGFEVYHKSFLITTSCKYWEGKELLHALGALLKDLSLPVNGQKDNKEQCAVF